MKEFTLKKTEDYFSYTASMTEYEKYFRDFLILRKGVQNGVLVYSLEQNTEPTRCMICNSIGLIGHGYKMRKIKDQPYKDLPVSLQVKVYRYYCPFCSKVTSYPLSITQGSLQFTKRFTKLLEWELLQGGSNLSIAKKYNISEFKVRTVRQQAHIPYFEDEH